MQKFLIPSQPKIEALADLQNFPDFRQGLKLTNQLKKSAEIIAQYRIPKEKIRCGLTCNQGHYYGYLLQLSDGSHTNVGHDCGEKHFGASDFTEQSNRIIAHDKLINQKIRINQLLDDIPSLIKMSNELRELTATTGKSLANFKEVYPPAIVDELKERSRRKQSRVTTTRKLSDSELAGSDISHYVDKSGQSKKANNSSAIIEETVGELKGLTIFIMQPRSLLKQVNEMIREVETADSEALTSRQISKFADYKRLIEQKFSEVKIWIDEGHRFFARENLALIPFLRDQRYLSDIEKIEWDFESRSGRILSKGQLKRLKRKLAI